MRIFTIPAALVTALLLAAPALATPPAGTQLSGQIQQNISTATANVGDAVTVTNVVAPGANIHNGTMYGTVTKVVRAGQGRQAQLQIKMHSLRLASGATYNVDGVVTGMTANTKNNALKEAAGAVGGMIVGNILGKTIFHTGGGGLVGAASGYLLAKNNRENMTVPKGSAVTVVLATARRQASRP